MKKPLLIAGIVTTIGLSGLGVGVANAATNSETKSGPMSGLVDAIATKFNLNKDDVQKVVDDQKVKMDTEREQQVTTELAQLVKDGKLTQAQADAITAKRAELQKTREANKDTAQSQSDTDRKAAMEKERTDLEAWAKQNNIDTQYLRFIAGHGRGGPGGGHGFGDKQGTPPATSTDTAQ